MDFFAACSTEIAHFFVNLKKKVVGSAQKLRVGRGALNTAIFFFFGLIKRMKSIVYWKKYIVFTPAGNRGVVDFTSVCLSG